MNTMDFSLSLQPNWLSSILGKRKEYLHDSLADFMQWSSPPSIQRLSRTQQPTIADP